MFRNILVCLDGAAMDEKITRLGLYLAQPLRSTLHGLTVQDQLSLDGPLMYDISGALALIPQLNLLTETKKILAERAEQILKNFDEACEQASIPHSCHSELGIVHRVVLQKAELNDLIIVGRRGLNYTLDEDLLGSTADRVIRHAASPVLVVSAPDPQLKNPLLAYDGSHSAKKALTTAAKFCSDLRLPLTVLHVGKNGSEILREAQQALSAYELLTKMEQIDGDPHQVIPQYAKQHFHDLMILGSRGRSGIIRFILGSTTQYALWSGVSHVLVVH